MFYIYFVLLLILIYIPRRWGIVSVTFLFIIGALLLQRVDEQQGRRVAETAEDWA
jgi:hypothetical protein